MIDRGVVDHPSAVGHLIRRALPAAWRMRRYLCTGVIGACLSFLPSAACSQKGGAPATGPAAMEPREQSEAVDKVATAPAASMSAAPSAAGDAPVTSRPARALAYKPGITLNYEKLQVEVESKVVLRQGELELLAWSVAPTPKEHETILASRAKPSDVYEALGLIGLAPGTPPRYDWEAQVSHPATGDAVDVLVAYERAGERVEHSICDWAIDRGREAPMEKRPWVFCGSHQTEQGAFAADIEGTLVTVVDFPSSLLSLGESHSDSDSALWLAANTDAIPPTGTDVTLILRAVGR